MDNVFEGHWVNRLQHPGKGGLGNHAIPANLRISPSAYGGPLLWRQRLGKHRGRGTALRIRPFRQPLDRGDAGNRVVFAIRYKRSNGCCCCQRIHRSRGRHLNAPFCNVAKSISLNGCDIANLRPAQPPESQIMGFIQQRIKPRPLGRLG